MNGSFTVMYTQEAIYTILAQVSDPEVPVLSILDLGIVREVIINETNHQITIRITPTYSGCPAMQTIAMQIKMEMLSNGYVDVQIEETLSPAWTTDWMTAAGKQKLQTYGIAPPQYRAVDEPLHPVIPCPLCHTTNTEKISQFGSTACKALYRCLDCLEPFDYFKCH